MRRVSSLLLLVLSFAGCMSGVEVGAERAQGVGPSAGGDASVSDADAAKPADGGTTGTCVPTRCRNQQYDCGDCEDNDDDGLVDMDDPECVGPCDNSEESFFGGIPGQNRMQCEQDCYFDQNSGLGNDRCLWSHSCDPLSVEPDFPPQGELCAYDPEARINAPGGPRTCSALQEQSGACIETCGALTPNGCDCFGCCEFPNGRHIWLGSRNELGEGTCTSDALDDPTRCRPCTPVASCFNACEPCELCVGKRELPANTECTGMEMDAGTADSGVCRIPDCRGDLQPCGVSCLPDCPPGLLCLTGCCIEPPR